MTGLLVSVRNAAEARIALEAGVDMIDVKEPANGSLGRASDEALAAVLREVAGRRPVSAALGELRDSIDKAFTTRTPSLSFAKLGLAGCASLDDWPVHWARALHGVVPPPRAVAVIYADWRAAEAPEPQSILAHAIKHGCGAVLIDTFCKFRGGLLDHWRVEEVADVVAQARAARMLSVVAGSLSMETIPRVLRCAPDLVAVRGAVCRDGRAGEIDGRLIQELLECLRAGRPTTPARNA